MAYIIMVYMVMAFIVMAFLVMAYIVMTQFEDETHLYILSWSIYNIMVYI